MAYEIHIESYKVHVYLGDNLDASVRTKQHEVNRGQFYHTQQVNGITIEDTEKDYMGHIS